MNINKLRTNDQLIEIKDYNPFASNRKAVT